LARRLQKHLRKKRAAKEKKMRSKIFEDYVPVILEEAAKLGEVEVPDYEEVLSKVTKRSIADLLGETVEEVEEEEEDALMEELDEFGYKVDEEHSNMTNIENKSVVEELEDELIIEEEDAKKTQSESKQSTLTKNEGD
ncbi:MAG: DNA topoisomerase VI subunit B, partial [Methanobacteriaceae archaeon]|nr:DNA topoisomerase VI subunit B [Methanobacteriaceae archaeon]